MCYFNWHYLATKMEDGIFLKSLSHSCMDSQSFQSHLYKLHLSRLPVPRRLATMIWVTQSTEQQKMSYCHIQQNLRAKQTRQDKRTLLFQWAVCYV